VVVGIQTWSGAHATRGAALLTAWVTDARAAGVTVLFFSDAADAALPAVRCAGCARDSNGLGCKTACMYRSMWESHPDKKWSVRPVDDSLAALWRLSGGSLAALWRLSGGSPTALWRLSPTALKRLSTDSLSLSL
jgi:hypothetical protein